MYLYPGTGMHETVGDVEACSYGAVVAGPTVGGTTN